MKKDMRRSSYRSHSRSTDLSSPCVMSQKFVSLSSHMRLFKGPESRKIDVAELRRIKVDIHRNIPAAEISTELQREILDPHDVKLKRRDGEGAKPIFEREELKRSEVPMFEVEEHRTVVALDTDRTEKSSYSRRKRPNSPMISHKQHCQNSRRDSDARISSEKVRSRDRSNELRERHNREDSWERRSSHKVSHYDLSRDRTNRHNRSSSRSRESRRSDTRRSRSSGDRVPHREIRDRDDSRERRSRDNRSRERNIAIPRHSAETMPVPMYYEDFHPRPIMVDPTMPMESGRMPSMMGPMRSPSPPRFMPPKTSRPALNPNQNSIECSRSMATEVSEGSSRRIVPLEQLFDF